MAFPVLPLSPTTSATGDGLALPHQELREVCIHRKNIAPVIEPDHEAVVPHGSGEAHTATRRGPDTRSCVDLDVDASMDAGDDPVPSDSEWLDKGTFDGPTGQAAGGHADDER